MGYFNQRTTPAPVFAGQRWIPGRYNQTFQGFTWPAIDYVPPGGGLPAHGVFHGAEGDIIVSVGDYIVLRPSNGAVSASSWYNFVGYYEEVLSVPA